MSQNKQQQLFDSEPAPWELDDAEQRWVATIVVPGGPPQELDYLVSEQLRPQLDVGRRVSAPLGRGDRTVIGYCTRLEYRAIGSRRLKGLIEVIDE